jgi:hypothetical protein
LKIVEQVDKEELKNEANFTSRDGSNDATNPLDYSAEAFEQYMDKQARARIANWADHSSACARNYLHPFDRHGGILPASAFGHVPEISPDDAISFDNNGASQRMNMYTRVQPPM